MLTVFFRTIIVFFAVLVILRLLGKRQIGEMQPFELAITLIIADLACIPMSDVTIPLLYGIVAILGLFLLHTVLIILNQKSMFFRRVLSGKPAIIITPDGIDFDMLRKLNMTISDLEEGMHNAQCFSFADIQYAILETNGVLSVVKKSEDSQSQTLPLVLISAGKIDTKSLHYLNRDKSIIDKILKENNIKDLKNVLILTIDNKGKLFIQEKYKKSISGSTFDLNGGQQWENQ